MKILQKYSYSFQVYHLKYFIRQSPDQEKRKKKERKKENKMLQNVFSLVFTGPCGGKNTFLTCFSKICYVYIQDKLCQKKVL